MFRTVPVSNLVICHCLVPNSDSVILATMDGTILSFDQVLAQDIYVLFQELDVATAPSSSLTRSAPETSMYSFRKYYLFLIILSFDQVLIRDICVLFRN